LKRALALRTNQRISMARNVKRSAGYSLIELLLVLTIMGILTAMAIPSANPSLHDQLEGVAQVLAGDLAYARNLAVVNDSTYRFTFDTVNNQYILKYSGTNPALTNLPKSPFGSRTDPASQQTVQLANLPHIGGSVQLAAVYSMATPVQAVTDLEFGPLGQTTRAGNTVIWLGAGTGTAARYLSVRVNSITGLTWIENFQTQQPTITQVSGS
jgi:prepilin-type N-terminal cleavage/methylation domain-containing protein